jgi:hypothetical protein
MPRRSWKSSNRVTPKKASRRISGVHHSPITSSERAMEQFISSNDVRRIGHTVALLSCMMKPFVAFCVA